MTKHTRIERSGNRQEIRIPSRSGFAAIWVIASIPIVIAAIAFVVSIGRLNIARTELKTAAEAGSLAGSLVWGRAGDGASNDTAGRVTGLVFANQIIVANSALGESPTVESIEMGIYTAGTFVVAASAPVAATRAVRITLSIPVSGKFGATTYTVKARATAWFNGSRAVLVSS